MQLDIVEKDLMCSFAGRSFMGHKAFGTKQWHDTYVYTLSDGD